MEIKLVTMSIKTGGMEEMVRPLMLAVVMKWVLGGVLYSQLVRENKYVWLFIISKASQFTERDGVITCVCTAHTYMLTCVNIVPTLMTA